MADGFKLTYNPKAENARLVREGIKGTGPGTKVAQGGKSGTRPPVKGGWNPLNWFKGKGAAAVTKGKAAVKAAPAVVKGVGIGAAKVAGPIVGGAVVGEIYKRTNRAPAVSGRGAGRATFQDSNNNNRPNLQANPNPNDDWADPVAGKGPENNQVGSDADPNTPGLQGRLPEKPAAPAKPAESTRVNANGLLSYGKDLSSLNAFTRAFTGGHELSDIKSAFQSEDLPTAYQNGTNSISTEQTPYELPEGAAPSPLNGGLAGAKDLEISDTTYTIGEASVPGTVGRSGDAQEGSSDKPDIADNVRTIRMNRNSGRGSRRDPRNRGEDPDMFGGPEPSDASLVSPMYANKKRNEIRSTFLDLDTPIIQASIAANAKAGYGQDSNGDARFNVGGELVYAKEGMQQQAKNAANMGKDPSEFLEKKIKEIQEE